MSSSTSSSQPLGHDNAQLIGYYLLCLKSLPPQSLMDNSDSSKIFKRRKVITFVSLLAQNNRIPQPSWREEEAEIQLLLDRNLVILVFSLIRFHDAGIEERRRPVSGLTTVTRYTLASSCFFFNSRDHLLAMLYFRDMPFLIKILIL